MQMTLTHQAASGFGTVLNIGGGGRAVHDLSDGGIQRHTSQKATPDVAVGDHGDKTVVTIDDKCHLSRSAINGRYRVPQGGVRRN
jgi:hypothetical protein